MTGNLDGAGWSRAWEATMTEGQFKLRRKGTQVAIARRCGVTKAAVSLWMRGDARPQYDSRVAINRAFPDIALDDWDKLHQAQQEKGRAVG